MLRLGHIDYSNCLPVHARLLEARATDLQVVYGTPTELNQALAAGNIDVAPCSSIEYAHHAQQYRLLPGLVIGSRGRVQSIRFESTRPLADLSGHTVALPTASATSVLLLRILLELRYGSTPNFTWYDQLAVADPMRQGAEAALWIGDQALQRPQAPDRLVCDLGELWYDWTGLPFAFALWQTRLGEDHDMVLRDLTARLHSSLHSSLQSPLVLAERYASHFGLPARQLADYWCGLQYSLDSTMQRGLLHFYELARQLGEIAQVPPLRWVPV